MYKYLSIILSLCFCPLTAVEEQKPEIEAVIFDYSKVRVKGENGGVLNWLGEKYEETKESVKEFYTETKEKLSSKEFWERNTKKVRSHLPESWQGKIEEEKERVTGIIADVGEISEALKRQGVTSTILSGLIDEPVERGFGPFSFGIGVENPTREDYIALAEEMGVAPEKCLLVDDNLENVQTARSVGIDAIHFTSVKELKKDLKKRGVRF